MCLMSYANNKGSDQPAHPRSLISAFVVRCLDSVMSLVSVTKISSLMLASVVAQAGLCLAWSETPEDTFCRVVAQMLELIQTNRCSIILTATKREGTTTKHGSYHVIFRWINFLKHNNSPRSSRVTYSNRGENSLLTYLLFCKSTVYTRVLLPLTFCKSAVYTRVLLIWLSVNLQPELVCYWFDFL